MARYPERIRVALGKINEGWVKSRRVYGVLGRMESDGSLTVRVAGDPTKAHVRVQGQQAATVAFHHGMVNLDSGGGEAIVMWSEDGKLHIEGYTAGQASEMLTSVIYARSGANGPVPGIFDKFTSDTDGVRTVVYLAHITDADMVDHFGVSIQMAIEDNAGLRHPVGFISGQRDGADDSGRLVFTPMSAGVAGPSLIIWSDGSVQMAGYGAGVATFDANGVISSDPAGGGGASTLDDLTDVDVSSPTDDYVLTYDAGTSTWGPEAVPPGGSVALNDLTDVEAASPNDGDVLTYDSAALDWVPAAPASAVWGWEFSAASDTVGTFVGSSRSSNSYPGQTTSVQLGKAIQITLIEWEMGDAETYSLEINGESVGTSQVAAGDGSVISFDLSANPYVIAAGAHSFSVTPSSGSVRWRFTSSTDPYQDRYFRTHGWDEVASGYIVPLKITGIPGFLTQ